MSVLSDVSKASDYSLESHRSDLNFQEDDKKTKTVNKAARSRKAKQWCQENYVNAKSLGIAIATARDFIRACKTSGIWQQHDQNRRLSNAEIQRLAVKGFFLNVALNTGGFVGRGTEYKFLRADKPSTGTMHPGSALSDAVFAGEDAPEWVVFNTVMKTSRTFLTVVTPIEREWLEEESPQFAKDLRTILDVKDYKSREEREADRTAAGLPVLACREAFIQQLVRDRVLIMTAETGSGKTTQLPMYCAEALLDGTIPTRRSASGKNMTYCTQPRALAAISVGKRVSFEYDGDFNGPNVGYQVGGTCTV